jgi:hypothetical protein
MTEEQRGYGVRPEQSRPTVLTAEAAAILSFTLAVLAMTGQGLWTQLAQTFIGATFREDQVLSVLAVAAVASLVLSAAAVLLARRALTSALVDGSWAGHLARAGLVLGAVDAVLSVLVLVFGTLFQGL